MNHYGTQLDARDQGINAKAEAERDRLMSRALDAATPPSIRDLLAMMVNSVERIAIALERTETIQGTEMPIIIPDDWPDAPLPNSIDEPAAQHIGENQRRQLIGSLHEMCWPHCKLIRLPDRPLGAVTACISNAPFQFNSVAKLLALTPEYLRSILKTFPEYCEDAQNVTVTFPVDWVRPS